MQAQMCCFQNALSYFATTVSYMCKMFVKLVPEQLPSSSALPGRGRNTRLRRRTGTSEPERCPSGPIVTKLFLSVIYKFLYQARVIVPGNISSLVKRLWVRPGACPRKEHLRGASLG